MKTRDLSAIVRDLLAVWEDFDASGPQALDPLIAELRAATTPAAPAPLDVGAELMKTVAAVASLRPTFPSMWLANIREAMHRAGMPRPENHHTTGTGSAIYFTDPEDGQRYRISVEPIKPEAEPKF